MKTLMSEMKEGFFALIGASMDKYVVETGIDRQVLLCEMLSDTILPGSLLRVFGFDENNCPFPPPPESVRF
ncbi:Protein of unknown function [Cotesia congregata]|uniref:Uncharacterized protein n=1 Tax=Cotesia congregata TaxID=51543 RepID=A0A8J2MKM2_COTCN|nr:Protein of unknown function [Cotesia congregata]